MVGMVLWVRWDQCYGSRFLCCKSYELSLKWLIKYEIVGNVRSFCTMVHVITLLSAGKYRLFRLVNCSIVDFEGS